MTAPIRIGIVGAGANTRGRHIPGLRRQEGVEIVSVCNRTAASTAKVAREEGIPVTHKHWPELVTSDAVDAIVVGTWPNLHCPVTVAGLRAGKHVLTEARMAMNAREAHLMWEESKHRPHLVAQVVPSPMTLRVDGMVRQLIGEGYLGRILALDVRDTSPNFADFAAPLHWRQDRSLSGLNAMTMGIWYEAIVRWVGEATVVSAMTSTHVKQRKSADGLLQTVTVPDHADILAGMACGAQARFQFSTVTGLAPAAEVWLYGSKATLRYEAASDKLFGGKHGDSSFHEISIPRSLAGGWRVEEEFINAIRGKETISRTSFEDGVKYMQFTEAVARSVSLGATVRVQDMR